MDRFDRLTRRLIEGLELRRASLGDEGRPAEGEGPSAAEAAAPDEVGPHAETAQLDAYLAGGLTPEKRAQVEEHLETCLACLDELVELRDLLSGVASPSPLEPGLEARLREAAGMPARPGAAPSLLARAWVAIRAAVKWQVPAGWALGGAVAGIVLAVVVVNLLQQQAQLHESRSLLTELKATAPEGAEFTQTLGGPPEVLQSRLGGALRLLPALTVVGVVAEVEQGTVQSATFHTFTMTGRDGKRYLFFAWGSSAIQANDRVEVKGVIHSDPAITGQELYLGVAESVSVRRKPP